MQDQYAELQHYKLNLISFFWLGIILHVYISMHLQVLSWLFASAIIVITHPRLVVITVDLHAASLFANIIRDNPMT